MRFKEAIREAFENALDAAGYGSGETPLILERPRQKEHGDICTPIAMSLAKTHRRNPMDIAEAIAGAASFSSDVIAAVDVVRPGFINLKFSQEVLVQNTLDVTRDGESYGKGAIGTGTKCQIEYVSANPTGPLVVVSARAAAVGSVIVNLLRAVGYEAEGEYYVNDHGKQIEKLGESLRFRVREKAGELGEGEEIGAYPGGYLKDIARHVPEKDRLGWDVDPDGAAKYGKFAAAELLEGIKSDLEKFDVHFDSFFLESTLHPDAVEEARRLVNDKGYAYEKDGALYLRTTDFGDEKDRVLVKSDGAPTYFLGDIAYHKTKLDRGFDWILDLLGPDHHGHIPRMKAASSVLGAKASWFGAMGIGWVRLLEGDKPIKMSKRAGDIIKMVDLIDDVGRDVAKYFFLMRRANSPLDFDLELARKQSDENPVYYVQYAHARISSVIRFARDKDFRKSDGSTAVRDLSSPEERELMLHLLYYPYEVEGAAMAREPHRLTVYARDLATLFHQFYHKHRIVTDDVDLSSSRMYLVDATRQVLKNTLTLLGVSAPSSM